LRRLPIVYGSILFAGKFLKGWHRYYLHYYCCGNINSFVTIDFELN
jgi:hypothetical protein